MIEAKIKITNSGRYYISLEADGTSIEELIDLTEFRRQTMISTHEVVNFGGGAGMFGENKDKQLDYTLNLMVGEKR